MSGIKQSNPTGGGISSPAVYIPQASQQGYVECPEGGVFDCSYPTSKTRRGRIQGNGCLLPTLTCNAHSGLRYYERYDPAHHRLCIRRLTPSDCLRCMGVNENNLHFIQQSGIPESQQYKLAGNSIVVDVLEHIFRKLFIDKENNSEQMSLF